MVLLSLLGTITSSVEVPASRDRLRKGRPWSGRGLYYHQEHIKRAAIMAWKRGWTWGPNRRLKPKVPDEVKAEVERKVGELVEKHLKPEHVKEPPQDTRWNYLTGIHTKWHKSFFYLVGDYASPGPNRIAPTFEHPFTRLEYTRDGKFNLAYMRHTGKWWQVHEGLTLDRAVK